MLRSVKVATPFTAGWSSVPLNVPGLSRPPLWPMAIVMLPLNVVTILFWSSTAATRTGGEVVAPGAVLVGGCRNTSLGAGPGVGGGVAVMANGAVVSPASADAAAVSVYPVPIRSIRKLAKVATPFTAATLVVPVRFALPSTATFTVSVKLVTTCPAESNAVTCTGGLMTLSFIVLSG